MTLNVPTIIISVVCILIAIVISSLAICRITNITTKEQRNAVQVKAESGEEKILNLFNTYRTVALSELHTNTQFWSFIDSLIRNPEFSKKVTNITFECGNELYQDIMDDYILRNKDIPLSELQKAWRNNTQASITCESPVYFNFLYSVRSINTTLPDSQKIRVLLIDPPIDWSTVKTEKDYMAQVDRETNMHKVIEREVYNKNQKVLFIAGGAHLSREKKDAPLEKNDTSQSEVIEKFDPGKQDTLNDTLDSEPQGNSSTFMSPLQWLEEKYPGSTFTIAMYEGFGNNPETIEDDKMSNWEKNQIVLTKDTWVGEQPTGNGGDIMTGPDGKPITTGSKKLRSL
jgi:hypothetical protein